MIAERIWLFGDYNQAESRVVAWRGPVPKLKTWYQEGKDVHLHVTQLIARVVQESRLTLPEGLFTRKHWLEYIKGDEEREQSKRIVHGYNYKVGAGKMSIILRVPEATAKLLMNIYDKLFPEIRLNYQAWIENEVRRTRTLWTPEPVRFRKVFWDQLNDDTFRQAYASYPQSTVGALLNRTLRICANIFKEDVNETLKDQWCAWYGMENWDHWRRLRDNNSRSPLAIRWSGMDIRLNVHDAGGISIPNDSDLISWAARTWKTVGEVTLKITPNPEDWLVIPIDFKTGPTWGSLSDYKLAA